LPEVFCIVGPRGAGKTKLGEALATRANMELLNFDDFLKARSLQEASCEEKTQALIDYFTAAIPPRFLLENFP
jgi:tRNA A37 N6-isopentenylltransferase MiaA